MNFQSFAPLPELLRCRPLVLITGFLGSGKTTFLRELLIQVKSKKLTADVILNDYENAELDAETLQGTAGSIEALSASCACCEGLDFLVEMAMTATSSRHELLFIEINGTADPIPLLESFILLESKLRRQPRWQVCVLDARHFGRRGRYQSLESLQLETASHFCLSHTDGLLEPAYELLVERVRAINSAASQISPQGMAAALSSIVEKGQNLVLSKPTSGVPKGGVSQSGQHGKRQAHEFTGCQILLPPMIARPAIWSWLAALPASVLRAKALVTIDDEPETRRLFERVGLELMADPLEVAISQRVPPSAILIGPDLDPPALLAIAQDYFGPATRLSAATHAHG